MMRNAQQFIFKVSRLIIVFKTVWSCQRQSYIIMSIVEENPRFFRQCLSFVVRNKINVVLHPSGHTL